LARQLKRWGLSGFAAAFLELGGPFTMLAAQGLYIGQPILGAWIPNEKISQFANLLEAPGEAAQFVRLLREEAP
jgi:hypothetical protein